MHSVVLQWWCERICHSIQKEAAAHVLLPAVTFWRTSLCFPESHYVNHHWHSWWSWCWQQQWILISPEGPWKAGPSHTGPLVPTMISARYVWQNHGPLILTDLSAWQGFSNEGLDRNDTLKEVLCPDWCDEPFTLKHIWNLEIQAECSDKQWHVNLFLTKKCSEKNANVSL